MKSRLTQLNQLRSSQRFPVQSLYTRNFKAQLLHSIDYKKLFESADDMFYDYLQPSQLLAQTGLVRLADPIALGCRTASSFQFGYSLNHFRSVVESLRYLKQKGLLEILYVEQVIPTLTMRNCSFHIAPKQKVNTGYHVQHQLVIRSLKPTYWQFARQMQLMIDKERYFGLQTLSQFRVVSMLQRQTLWAKIIHQLKERCKVLTAAKNLLNDQQGLDALVMVKQTLNRLQVKNKLIQQLHTEISVKKEEQMKQNTWRAQLLNSCQAQQNLLDNTKAEVLQQQLAYKQAMCQKESEKMKLEDTLAKAMRIQIRIKPQIRIQQERVQTLGKDRDKRTKYLQQRKEELAKLQEQLNQIRQKSTKQSKQYEQDLIKFQHDQVKMNKQLQQQVANQRKADECFTEKWHQLANQKLEQLYDRARLQQNYQQIQLLGQSLGIEIEAFPAQPELPPIDQNLKPRERLRQEIDRGFQLHTLLADATSQIFVASEKQAEKQLEAERKIADELQLQREQQIRLEERLKQQLNEDMLQIQRRQNAKCEISLKLERVARRFVDGIEFGPAELLSWFSDSGGVQQNQAKDWEDNFLGFWPQSEKTI